VSEVTPFHDLLLLFFLKHCEIDFIFIFLFYSFIVFLLVSLVGVIRRVLLTTHMSVLYNKEIIYLLNPSFKRFDFQTDTCNYDVIQRHLVVIRQTRYHKFEKRK